MSLFLWVKLRSCSSLFLRELGRSSAPRGLGPAAAEAVKRLSLRRSQMEKLHSCSSLFLRELGRSSAPRSLGPAAAEAVKRLSSRRSQMELALHGEHARSVLEGMGCVHCEPFLWEKLRSYSSLFLRELGRSSAPRGSGPAAAEAVKRLSSRRSQMGLA